MSMEEYEATGARFSACEDYRYELIRIWEKGAPLFVVIGLNPSTATAHVDDPTIRRCVGFAKRDGCGGLIMLNLFALRSTDPKLLYDVPDPVGAHNDEAFIVWQGHAAVKTILAAWGAHGKLGGRGAKVAAMLRATRALVGGPALTCLKVNADGTPKHPLYVRADAPLIPYLETT